MNHISDEGLGVFSAMMMCIKCTSRTNRTPGYTSEKIPAELSLVLFHNVTNTVHLLWKDKDENYLDFSGFIHKLPIKSDHYKHFQVDKTQNIPDEHAH